MSGVVYTCQQCDKQGTDKSEFRMIVLLKTIGYVMCKACLVGEAVTPDARA